jgi:hypothetical protein
MKRTSVKMIVVSASILAASLASNGAASAAVTRGPVTRTFSFIGAARSKTVTLVNADSLLINARCNAQGDR